MPDPTNPADPWAGVQVLALQELRGLGPRRDATGLTLWVETPEGTVAVQAANRTELACQLAALTIGRTFWSLPRRQRTAHQLHAAQLIARAEKEAKP